MKEMHTFSRKYEEKKAALIAAVRDTEAAPAAAPHKLRPILIAAALISLLGISTFAAYRAITFTLDKEGDHSVIHIALDTEAPSKPVDSGSEQAPDPEKPLRQWNPGEGEEGIRLIWDFFPADLVENPTTPSKYQGNADERTLTVLGIDLRRDSFESVIRGDGEELLLGGRRAILITGEGVIDKTVWILFEEADLAVQMYVGRGIRRDELISMCEGLTIEPTASVEGALPILLDHGPGKVIHLDPPDKDAVTVPMGDTYSSKNGEYEFTLLGAEILDDWSVLDARDIFREPKADNPRMLVVTLRVKNRTGEAQDAYFPDFPIVTPDMERSAEASFVEGSGSRSGSPYIQPMKPGEVQTVRLGYFIDGNAEEDWVLGIHAASYGFEALVPIVLPD